MELWYVGLILFLARQKSIHGQLLAAKSGKKEAGVGENPSPN